MTIRQLADEMGVSKQAVYKRVRGKLKSVLEPYIYTEYNCMCITDEGADIVRKDFAENPCATPLFAYGSNTENKPETHTEEPNKNAISTQNPTLINSVCTPDTCTPETSVPNTEQAGNAYGALQQNIELRVQLSEQEKLMHEKELELVKSNAEIDKLKETIKHLEQRIDDKDTQIAEQRRTIQKTDNERKILTASLFRNNEFIEQVMRLSLRKRMFGWKNVQNKLMTSQNNIADDVSEGENITVSDDDSDK